VRRRESSRNTDVTRAGAKQQQIDRHGRHSVDNEPTLEVVDGDLARLRHHLQQRTQREATFGFQIRKNSRARLILTSVSFTSLVTINIFDATAL